MKLIWLFKNIKILAIQIFVASLSCDYGMLCNGVEKRIENFRLFYPTAISHESLQHVMRKL